MASLAGPVASLSAIRRPGPDVRASSTWEPIAISTSNPKAASPVRQGIMPSTASLSQTRIAVHLVDGQHLFWLANLPMLPYPSHAVVLTNSHGSTPYQALTAYKGTPSLFRHGRRISREQQLGAINIHLCVIRLGHSIPIRSRTATEHDSFISAASRMDISLLLVPKDDGEVSPRSSTSVAPISSSSSAKRSAPSPTSDSPAKKQSKWSAEEDALIIELRGSGLKWEEISRKLPGRSAISCRLHYQNYLERRSEWDEERKNKLARLYERFKQEMWSKIAEEMMMPWRATEAMHWQLGEQDMARRAGVVPFSLTNLASDPPYKSRRTSSTSSRSRRESAQRPLAPHMSALQESSSHAPPYSGPIGPAIDPSQYPASTDPSRPFYRPG
ncbi:MAG: hypothetical protein M1825_001869 [Sarcosagium campestre]|nr:MAG: hypothetical protein M1825_001869 [Sarcosagium campestre]